MHSSAERDDFKSLMQKCSQKLHPTRDEDMFIFYMGMDYLEKAVEQASASIEMEMTDEEVKKWTYRKKVDEKLKQLKGLFREYVSYVKGFEDDKYFYDWINGMEDISKEREKWEERAKEYVKHIHSFVFAA